VIDARPSAIIAYMKAPRMTRIAGPAALAAIAAAIAFLHWPAAERKDDAAITVREFGERAARALIAVEPSLEAQDYRGSEALREKLRNYLETARREGLLAPGAVAVFPEHVGTWLVAAHAPGLAYRARSLSSASVALILDDPIAYAIAFSASKEKDRSGAALFRARSARMAKDYQATFGALAKEYGVTIIAGSIALQDPAIIDGAIRTRAGPLYNVSAVFRPDGSVHPLLVFKRYPIPAELSFLSPGDQPMPAFETPIGRVGVLICADSWHPELYEELAANRVGAVAVPAYIAKDGAWTKPWGGYVTPEPGDVAHGDVGALSEGDAWRKYALPSRIRASGAAFGATAFLRGGPWDLGADGRALAVAGDSAFVGEKVEGGVVSVVWR
jgi:hypothetical protein